jgi:hypothetical protein
MKWKKLRERNYKEKKMAGKTAEPTFQMTDSGVQKVPKHETVERKSGNVNAGMELLDLDFLLSVVETTNGEEMTDVTMRKLTFNELLRRENQNHIDSRALAVYVVDQNGQYGRTTYNH